MVKKKNSNEFAKAEQSELYQNGVNLAFKALKKGTFYAVSGFALFCFSVYYFSGAKSVCPKMHDNID